MHGSREVVVRLTLSLLALFSVTCTAPSPEAQTPNAGPSRESGATAGSSAALQWLHVIVDRLPQCPYGIPFERPMVIELLWDDVLVASADSAGTSNDVESLRVALHVPQAQPGRYTLRIGLCPSLSDPQAALACESPEWISERDVRLAPAGIEAPITVHPGTIRTVCRDGSTAQYP
jgi:hypothetical protein